MFRIFFNFWQRWYLVDDLWYVRLDFWNITRRPIKWYDVLNTRINSKICICDLCVGIGRWAIGSAVQVTLGDFGWHVILHWFISPGLFISFLRYLTWHILGFHHSRAWFLYTYVLLFSGKLYGFYGDGLLCSEKRNVFSKNFVLTQSRFLFFAPPGFSCWKFISTRILGESQYRWLSLRVWSLPTLLYFTYALTSRVKWIHPCSQHTLFFRYF